MSDRKATVAATSVANQEVSKGGGQRRGAKPPLSGRGQSEIGICDGLQRFDSRAHGRCFVERLRYPVRTGRRR
jgi:hypothetical protein